MAIIDEYPSTQTVYIRNMLISPYFAEHNLPELIQGHGMETIALVNCKWTIGGVRSLLHVARQLGIGSLAIDDTAAMVMGEDTDDIKLVAVQFATSAIEMRLGVLSLAGQGHYVKPILRKLLRVLHRTSIRELYLSDLDLQVDEMTKIVQSLSFCLYLSHLDVSNNPALGDDSVMQYLTTKVTEYTDIGTVDAFNAERFRAHSLVDLGPNWLEAGTFYARRRPSESWYKHSAAESAAVRKVPAMLRDMIRDGELVFIHGRTLTMPDFLQEHSLETAYLACGNAVATGHWE